MLYLFLLQAAAAIPFALLPSRPRTSWDYATRKEAQTFGRRHQVELLCSFKLAAIKLDVTAPKLSLRPIATMATKKKSVRTKARNDQLCFRVVPPAAAEPRKCGQRQYRAQVKAGD